MPLQFRHPRGRGLLLDNAEVSRGSFISRDSIVQGRARIRDASLLNGSCADEECQIYEATVDRSYIGGRTIVSGCDVRITEDSVVCCRSISGRARITRSRLENLVEVYDDAVVDRCCLRDAVMVYGTARLFGPFIVGGFARIERGEWTRPPRVADLGSAYLTESVGGVMVECRYNSFDWWLRFGASKGREAGWTDQQIKDALNVIKEWSMLEATAGPGPHRRQSAQ